MARGKVKWFNAKKGFGFIVDPEINEDVFVHFSEIQCDGFRTLDEGDAVDYEIEHDGRGYKAKSVVRRSE